MVQKFVVSKILKNIYFYSADALNCSKVTVKTFIMLQRLIKCCSFELSIFQRTLKKLKDSFQKNTKAPVFNNDDNKKCVLVSMRDF